MKKSLVLPIAIVVSLIIGFFIGQEYTKYTIRQSIDDAISDIGESLGSPETNTEEENQGMKKEVEKMNNVGVEIGETAELATLKYVVNSAEEKDMIKSSYGQPHLATEGTKFVVIDLTATNIKSETFEFDDDTFRIEDSNGNYYESYGDTIGNIDDYLAWKELSPNIPVSGYVVFQLPSSSESYDLIAKKANSNDLFRVKLK